MHEMSTVLAVIRIAEEVLEENNLSNIESVTLEIGEVSGILPEFLHKCWGFAISRSRYAKNAVLKVEMLSAVTICRACGCQYETVKYAKTCPECGSSHTELLCGNEYNIKEIEAS